MSVLLAQETGESLGLSGRAHVVVFGVALVGAWFLLRLLRRRQMRGKYTLLWAFVGLVVIALAIYPAGLDRTSRWLNIYYAPSTLFIGGIAFLLLVCIYFSWELSRLEERTRVLAEELAILRSEQERSAVEVPHQPDVENRQTTREPSEERGTKPVGP